MNNGDLIVKVEVRRLSGRNVTTIKDFRFFDHFADEPERRSRSDDILARRTLHALESALFDLIETWYEKEGDVSSFAHIIQRFQTCTQQEQTLSSQSAVSMARLYLRPQNRIDYRPRYSKHSGLALDPHERQREEELSLRSPLSSPKRRRAKKRLNKERKRKRISPTPSSEWQKEASSTEDNIIIDLSGSVSSTDDDQGDTTCFDHPFEYHDGLPDVAAQSTSLSSVPVASGDEERSALVSGIRDRLIIASQSCPAQLESPLQEHEGAISSQNACMTSPDIVRSSDSTGEEIEAEMKYWQSKEDDPMDEGAAGGSASMCLHRHQESAAPVRAALDRRSVGVSTMGGDEEEEDMVTSKLMEWARQVTHSSQSNEFAAPFAHTDAELPCQLDGNSVMSPEEAMTVPGDAATREGSRAHAFEPMTVFEAFGQLPPLC